MGCRNGGDYLHLAQSVGVRDARAPRPQRNLATLVAVLLIVSGAHGGHGDYVQFHVGVGGGAEIG